MYSKIMHASQAFLIANVTVLLFIKHKKQKSGDRKMWKVAPKNHCDFMVMENKLKLKELNCIWNPKFQTNAFDSSICLKNSSTITYINIVFDKIYFLLHYTQFFMSVSFRQCQLLPEWFASYWLCDVIFLFRIHIDVLKLYNSHTKLLLAMVLDIHAIE